MQKHRAAKTVPQLEPKKQSSLINNPKFKRAARPEQTCKEEVGLIADYLAGRLDAAIIAAFERRLSECDDCAAFLNTYKKTIEATKAFLLSQSVKVSPLPLLRGPRKRRNHSPG